MSFGPLCLSSHGGSSIVGVYAGGIVCAMGVECGGDRTNGRKDRGRGMDKRT